MPLVLASALVATAACTSGNPAGHVAMTVTPLSGLTYGSFDVTLTGLKPGIHVAVQASAKDAKYTYTSRVTFAADSGGKVDAAKNAPLSGSYHGAYASGLLWSMTAPVDEGGFRPPAGAYPITVIAQAGGHTVATVTATRRYAAAGLGTQTLTIARDGLAGVLVYPTGHTTRQTAILVLGGSEGGEEPADAIAHASEGYPTLALA
jgi:Acyl-CoA thioester hydrolase/BAAT N-terminal region